MALFILNSDITIGNYRFSGVNEVTIKRSVHSAADTATIKIPVKSATQKGSLQPDGSIKINPGAAVQQYTYQQFKVDDPVTIKLGYNGAMNLEFMGFVKQRGLNMPLEIECEGYIRQLRTKVTLNGEVTNTKVSQLLKMAAGIIDINGNKLSAPLTDITVHVVDDMDVSKFIFTDANGEQSLEEIKKLSAGTLAIFFITPTVLWCGLIYTAYAAKKDPFGTGTVNYRLGYNCIKNNSLKERVAAEPVEVVVNTRTPDGKLIKTTSTDTTAIKKQKIISNHVQTSDSMTKMANEKQLQLNYNGLQGTLQAFLQPYCLPGYLITVSDTQFPDLTAAYLAVSVEVTWDKTARAGMWSWARRWDLVQQKNRTYEQAGATNSADDKTYSR
jgi:hypothetical protein